MKDQPQIDKYHKGFDPSDERLPELCAKQGFQFDPADMFFGTDLGCQFLTGPNGELALVNEDDNLISVVAQR